MKLEPVVICIACHERNGRVALIAACYRAAHRAVRLWRAYKSEPDTSGRREQECADAVRVYRKVAKEERIRMRQEIASCKCWWIARVE